jgi:hypothetical protein
MKKIAVSLVLAASLGLAACGSEERLPPDEALDPAEAADAIAKAQTDAKAAGEAEVADLEKKLASAKTGQDYVAVILAAGKYPKIKQSAQKELEKIVDPIINSTGKSWAPIDDLLKWLPNSNPLWMKAYNKKEELKKAASKS